MPQITTNDVVNGQINDLLQDNNYDTCPSTYNGNTGRVEIYGKLNGDDLGYGVHTLQEAIQNCNNSVDCGGFTRGEHGDDNQNALQPLSTYYKYKVGNDQIENRYCDQSDEARSWQSFFKNDTVTSESPQECSYFSSQDLCPSERCEWIQGTGYNDPGRCVYSDETSENADFFTNYERFTSGSGNNNNNNNSSCPAPGRVKFQKDNRRNSPNPLYVTVDGVTYTGKLVKNSDTRLSENQYSAVRDYMNSLSNSRNSAESYMMDSTKKSEDYYYKTLFGANDNTVADAKEPKADMYTVEWENQDGTTFLYNYPVNHFEDPMLLTKDKEIVEDDKTRILMENENGRKFYYDIHTDSVINYEENKAKNNKISKLENKVKKLEKKLDKSVKVDPTNVNNVKQKIIYPSLYGNNEFDMSNNLNNVTSSSSLVEQQEVAQQEVAQQEVAQQEVAQVEQQQEEQILEEEEEIQVFDPSNDNNTAEKINGLGWGTKLLLLLVIVLLLCGLGYAVYYLLNNNNIRNTLLSNRRNNLRNNLLR